MKDYEIIDTGRGGNIRPVIGIVSYVLIDLVLKVWLLFVGALYWAVRILDFVFWLIFQTLNYILALVYTFLSGVKTDAIIFQRKAYTSALHFSGFDIIMKPEVVQPTGRKENGE